MKFEEYKRHKLVFMGLINSIELNFTQVSLRKLMSLLNLCFEYMKIILKSIMSLLVFEEFIDLELFKKSYLKRLISQKVGDSLPKFELYLKFWFLALCMSFIKLNRAN